MQKTPRATHARKACLCAAFAALLAAALAGCGVLASTETSSEGTAADPATETIGEAAAGAAFTMTKDEIDEAYAGVLDGNASLTAYYFGNDDLSKGGIVFLDAASGQSKSFMGEMAVGADGNGLTSLQITDAQTGETIAFFVADREDDTYTFDFGDDGRAVMAETTAEDVINAVNAISANGE